MRKTTRNAYTTEKIDEFAFAKKVLSQIVVSVVVFVLVLVNSKLNNKVSVDINNQIKHYLTSNIDFSRAIDVAVAYFKDFLEPSQTLPANSNVNIDTTETE